MILIKNIFKRTVDPNLRKAVKDSEKIMQKYIYENVFKSSTMKELLSDTFEYKGQRPDTILLKDLKTGKPFLTYKYEGKSAGIITDEMWADLDAQIAKFGIRNATTTCIAPTGTISMIAGASGGVEPLFGLVFIRDVMDGTIMMEINPIFEQYARKHGFYSDELMKKISDRKSVV